jgi:hypothetical protein
MSQSKCSGFGPHVHQIARQIFMRACHEIYGGKPRLTSEEPVGPHLINWLHRRINDTQSCHMCSSGHHVGIRGAIFVVKNGR